MSRFILVLWSVAAVLIGLAMARLVHAANCEHCPAACDTACSDEHCAERWLTQTKNCYTFVAPNGSGFLGHCNPKNCCPYDQVVKTKNGTCTPTAGSVKVYSCNCSECCTNPVLLNKREMDPPALSDIGTLCTYVDTVTRHICGDGT